MIRRQNPGPFLGTTKDMKAAFVAHVGLNLEAHPWLFCGLRWLKSGSEKGVFWKRCLFRKVHFLENAEILEILENPQTVENKGESDHFLEILENLEILEILEIPPVERPLL